MYNVSQYLIVALLHCFQCLCRLLEYGTDYSICYKSTIAIQINNQHDIGEDEKSDVQSELYLSEETLSEDRLSPSIAVDSENLRETRDLLLKLEVDEDIVDDSDDIQSGNDDTSPTEDTKVNRQTYDKINRC